LKGGENMDKEHKQLLLLLNKEKDLNEQLKQVKEEIKQYEEIFLKEMEKGKTFSWCWKYIISRTNISWKDKFIEVTSKKKAEEIMAKTEATIYPHLGVLDFHDPKNYPPVPIETKTTKVKLTRKSSK
jgi:hypothetical protein